jgi:Co/Zn/Cd efflux system component
MIKDKEKNNRRHRLISYRQRATEHWKDANEMHDVLHRLPGYLKTLLPELLDNPMSREEIMAHIKKLQQTTGEMVINEKKKDGIDSDIQLAIKLGVIREEDGRYNLTPGGRELAEFMQEIIPFFMNKIFSPQMASLITIFVHILLSCIKLFFGFFSRSAGLISDGIDNLADTISSFLVWLGIKFKKERLASLLVIIMMFVSLGGIIIITYQKIIDPGPVREGMITFAVSAMCGILMLGLSAYQYMTGKRHSNFAIMCQSVDSRNHFYTSFLVCLGIVLSFLAESYQIFWLYYADAGVSLLIGFLILKSAVELIAEFKKPEGEITNISHFLARAQEKVKEKAITEWLYNQLEQSSMNGEQLQQRFNGEFCEKVPKILILSGIGYQPQNSNDLWFYLDKLIKNKKVVLVDGEYSKKGKYK